MPEEGCHCIYLSMVLMLFFKKIKSIIHKCCWENILLKKDNFEISFDDSDEEISDKQSFDI